MTVKELKQKIRRLTDLAHRAGWTSGSFLNAGNARSTAELFDAELAKFEAELDAYILEREAVKAP